MQRQSEHLYAFGDFLLDPAERRLLRSGEPVPLTPKVFELLLTLVERQGRVVEKEQLMQLLWPDQYVEESNLKQSVSVLRKALGDSRARPRYVETVPKVGYRFVAGVTRRRNQEPSSAGRNPAGVEIARDGEELGGVAQAAPNLDKVFKTGGADRSARPAQPLGFPQNRFKAAGGRVALVAALLVVSAALVIVYAVYRSHSRAGQASPFARMKVTRLTNGGTWVPAISPDGKFVAYITNGAQGQPSVWVREVSTGNASQLVPSDGFNYGGLTFSRDGSYVYYERSDLQNLSDHFLGDAYRIPVMGGTPRLVASKVSGGVFPSPDNRLLAFIRFNPGREQNELIVINADGADERVIATRHWPDLSWVPTWSPDGRLIAFCARNREGDGFYNTVMAVPAGGGAEFPLTRSRWLDVGAAVWLPDGGGLAITARERVGDPFQVYIVSYPGGEVRRVTNDVNSYSAPGGTADGKTLVAEVAEVTANIWVLPEGDSARARQITSGGKDGIGGLAWTPDGGIIYATLSRDKYNETGATADKSLWVVDGGGGVPERLTSGGEVDADPAVTPDGRHVVFSSYRDGAWGIWRVDRDGRNPKRLAGGGTMTSQACSPDGRWVVFRSGPLAVQHVWRVPVEGGEAAELSDRHAYAPAVSPDGRQIAFFSAAETSIKLLVIPAAGGEPVKTFDDAPDSRYTTPLTVRWMPDGRLLTYVDNVGEASNIWGQPAEGGKARQLTQFDAGMIFNFAWAPDGRQLAVARGQYNRQIVLIEDFR